VMPMTVRRSFGGRNMDNEVIGQAKSDQDVLAFDVPDDALERAASTEPKAHTWVYCTFAWYNCGWPQ
jgi:hypothetical protein